MLRGAPALCATAARTCIPRPSPKETATIIPLRECLLESDPRARGKVRPSTRSLNAGESASGLGRRLELLRERQALALVVRADPLAINLGRYVGHLLVTEPADR